MDIIKECKKINEKIITHRRQLHSMAEVGFDLPRTSAYIFDTLASLGYSPRRIAGCGVSADIGDVSGDVILLRADIDALPIKEETGLKFAAQNGNMHACGHDMHAAMLLGAAEIIMKEKEKLKAGVRLLFQPAEELLEGAVACIKEGVLDGVGAAFMLHCLTSLPLPCGTAIVSSPGVGAPGAVYFDIDILGEAAHGAMPSLGIDPIYPMAQIVNGIYHIRSHELSSTDPSVLSIGRIAGGSASNALADKVTASGTLRSYEKEKIELMKKRIWEISESIARAYGAHAKVSFPRSCPPLLNNEELSRGAFRLLREIIPNALLSDELKRGAPSGSEDFAYISERAPSLMIGLCAGESSKGYEHPLHHPKCDFDEDALHIGAAIYASIALENKKKV
ncbi:MAG: amidohydrolase [Clostridia bacterium]|nr:amidohydrolase [Clostridia bacterium]